MCDNEDTEEPALLLSLVKKEQLQRILAHVLDENKFLSPYGIRSLSKVPQSYSAPHYTCILYEHLYAVNIYHLKPLHANVNGFIVKTCGCKQLVAYQKFVKQSSC